MENKQFIDVLNLSDTDIDALSRARMSGRTRGFPLLDKLCDGGAQLVRSFGRDSVKANKNISTTFELTTSEFGEMQRLLKDPELQKPLKIYHGPERGYTDY
jgi:hypothetical protein